MCGIAGLIAAEREFPIHEGPLWEAAKLLHHRGPDGSNVWSEPGIGLSHTRLAIIDRARGDQPMFSADGRYVVVFNGEIYNHHDLRRDLEGRGYELRSRCDTEVLLYLYDWLGEGMVDRLRGMFAFAVADRREHRALLARDRFGKKPLYYSEAGGAVRFASTLDALRPLLTKSPKLDINAIAQYLVLQYVPSPLTPYQGVSKLAPGHLATWRDGSLAVRRYWQPPERSVAPIIIDPRETRARLRELIRDAVSVRMESEVPLGVFLSGGLDSSTVVAEMAAAGVQPKTYSVGFEHHSFDETRYARVVADRFGTDHHELKADQAVEDTFRDFVTFYDEPFADSSALATLAVAKAASEHVTVILTGDGGDEMFGGYTRYALYRKAQQIRGVSVPMARLAGRGLRSLTGAAGLTRLSEGASFLRDPWHGYRDRLFHFQPRDLPTLLRAEAFAEIDADAPVKWLEGRRGSQPHNASSLMLLDQQTYLPDDLLTKMDRATMAHSLEGRSPLLDHELAAFSATLPEAWLIQGFTGKKLLRDAYGDVLPKEVLTRRKKGFGVPLAVWLRGELRPVLEDSLLSDAGPIWGWVDRHETTTLVKRFLAGDDGCRWKVWNLLALAGWSAERVMH